MGLLGRGDAGVSRAGQSRGAQHLLHGRLVAEIVGGSAAHAGNAEFFPHLAKRYLEFFKGTEQAVDFAHIAAGLPDACSDMAGVECIGNLLVGGQFFAHRVRHPVERVLADQADTGIRERTRGFNEAQSGLQQKRGDEHNVWHNVDRTLAGGASHCLRGAKRSMICGRM